MFFCVPLANGNGGFSEGSGADPGAEVLAPPVAAWAPDHDLEALPDPGRNLQPERIGAYSGVGPLQRFGQVAPRRVHLVPGGIAKDPAEIRTSYCIPRGQREKNITWFWCPPPG